MAKVTDLDAYRDQREADLPVWRVVKGHCTSCGDGHGIEIHHEECSLDNSECPACGQMAWKVTHFVVGDGVLEPRLEIV